MATATGREACLTLPGGGNRGRARRPLRRSSRRRIPGILKCQSVARHFERHHVILARDARSASPSLRSARTDTDCGRRPARSPRPAPHRPGPARRSMAAMSHKVRNSRWSGSPMSTARRNRRSASSSRSACSSQRARPIRSAPWRTALFGRAEGERHDRGQAGQRQDIDGIVVEDRDQLEGLLGAEKVEVAVRDHLARADRPARSTPRIRFSRSTRRQLSRRSFQRRRAPNSRSRCSRRSNGCRARAMRKRVSSSG